MSKASSARVERRKQLKRSRLFERRLPPTPKPDATLRLSNEGARRAMLALSPDGQAMLMAMMRYVAGTSTDKLVLGDASRQAGFSDHRARQGIAELQSVHLLATGTAGVITLHPLFASTGHAWRCEGSKHAEADLSAAILPFSAN